MRKVELVVVSCQVADLGCGVQHDTLPGLAPGMAGSSAENSHGGPYPPH